MNQHSKNLLLIISLLFIVRSSPARESTTKEFIKISCPEKWWAITHPFVACKAHKLTVKAREASKEMMNDSLLDHDSNGGQVDAFRHAYWMALLSQHMSSRKARSLGKAHEKGDYKTFKKQRMEEGFLPDSMAGVMDLYNNETGLAIGNASKELTEQALKELVKQKVLAGEMKILKKDKDKSYLTCAGEKIDLQRFLGQWNIPKCLVNSNANQH